ncbi:MAG TPA: ribosome maturation factor RimM [Candidatus Koribacter sp.]|jgi:16S rRNA processing protein RimM
MSSTSSTDEFVTIARVQKTQGRIGEVFAELFTDFPELFEQRHKLFALPEKGQRRELELEDHWFHKGGVVLKFQGIETMNDAETLLRSEIQIPGLDRAQLEEGATYVSDLVGCELFEIQGSQTRKVGVVADVDFSAGEAPLLVVKGDREYLIPYVEGFLKSRDFKAKRIEMVLPEGMLELDAPLSKAERERQKSEADEARAAGERRKR